MYQFNKKQRIILGMAIAIVVGFICYYVYAREDNNSIPINLENSIDTKEEIEEQEKNSDDTILVHVSGAVNKEGIVELRVDSRISDAIEKAGGIKEEASMETINLAYKLEDGMKIHIPTKQEMEGANKTKEEVTEQYVTTSSGGANKKEEAGSNSDSQIKVNINTATQTQLESLPGIGPSTATKIINYRKEKGKFSKIEEIKEVNGIGESKFNKIKDLIAI